MKSKIIYAGSRQLKCPICNRITEHILFDYNYRLYKCVQCNNVHA